MKKLTKLLALVMTGGVLLVGCGEADDIENDLPDVEDPADPVDPELDEELDEEMDEDMEDDAE